ncbi:MAG: hypothetical protein WDO73_27510 [Ignavibacteriota bacterium]
MPFLLRPLPFPNGDALLLITQAQRKTSESNVAPVRLEDWNAMNNTMLGVSGYYSQDTPELSGEVARETEVPVRRTAILTGVGRIAGNRRDFTEQEFHDGGPNAILISDRLWRAPLQLCAGRPGKDTALWGKRPIPSSA